MFQNFPWSKPQLSQDFFHVSECSMVEASIFFGFSLFPGASFEPDLISFNAAAAAADSGRWDRWAAASVVLNRAQEVPWLRTERVFFYRKKWGGGTIQFSAKHGMMGFLNFFAGH